MFTNKTANLDLPQWIGSDKANWDIDLNYAFKQISDYVTTLNEKFSGLDSTDGQFDASIKEINKNIETINSAIDSINEVDGIQSADITDLKEKVTKLQTDMSDLTTSSTDLTQRVQTIENELPQIQQSITTLTQNYNILSSKVTFLTNRTMLVSKDVTYPDGTVTDDYFTEEFAFPHAHTNAIINVGVSPAFLSSVTNVASNTYKILECASISLNSLNVGDTLLILSGIHYESFENGTLVVSVERKTSTGVELKIKYSPANYNHNFNGAPKIRITMTGENAEIR